MVVISSDNTSKIEFNKLNDPNDTTFTRVYKHLFRYASPNLLIWGPLAPAHDALFARTAMARIQVAAGIVLIGGAFRRFSPGLNVWKRRFTRLTSFTAGSMFVITGIREVSYFDNPHSNPLYVEIQLARELSLLNPENKGVVNRGSYWLGPKNFMPMNNEQYWKMVYTMEVNEIMADQYLESPLLVQYKEILDRKYGPDSKVDLKARELTARIEDITKGDAGLPVHSCMRESINVFPLFTRELNTKKSQTLNFWTVNNPLDSLQLQEYKDFYSYEFPRMKYPEVSK